MNTVQETKLGMFSIFIGTVYIEIKPKKLRAFYLFKIHLVIK